MYNKGDLNNNENNFKNFTKISKEQSFQQSFSFIFSQKESIDDIKFGNDIYYFHHKSKDISKNKTNDSQQIDYNITKICNSNDLNESLSKQNESNIINKNKEKDNSKNNRNIYIHRNNKANDIKDSKQFEHKDMNVDKSKSKEKTNNNLGINNIKILQKESAKIWIRGPYKKKQKIIQKVKIDDKCFPFTSGQGLNKLINNKGLQIINEFKNKYKKEINHKNSNNLFKTSIDNTDAKEKVKKSKKQRKFKSDDIRKKIKVKFHRALKDIINENLKKAGSEELFTFLPQSFIGNISKIFNKKYMNLTYHELLSIDYTELKNNNIEEDMEQKQIIKNKNVLEYLKNNPEISNNSGYDIIKDMKYKDLLQLYFSSKEFENSIFQLKNKNESIEYIDSYIKLSQDYINFFSDTKNYTIKKDNKTEDSTKFNSIPKINKKDDLQSN